jgi:thiol-disulfide isomerase/thioredoxin
MNSIYHKNRTWLRCTSSILFLCSAVSVVGGAEPPPSFTNDLGWTWHCKPFAFFPLQDRSPAQLSDWDIMYWYPVSSHELLLNWACQSCTSPEVLLWRPITFNASGERFEFAGKSFAGTRSNLEFRVYLLDTKTVPVDEMKFIGIEKLTEEGYRNIRVPAASRQLEAAGVRPLPVPRIGERYDFEVTASDGKKIRAADLRGQVVLLDFWATTCPPCLAKMPHLKEIYSKWHRDGFEIIGLNLDSTLAAARQGIVKQSLPWINVPGPEDKSHRELWGEAAGVFYIPRLLLIDRDGTLRADVPADKLEGKIEKLVRKR